MLSRVEVAIGSEAKLGECPRWDAAARRLLWVDIEGRELHVFDPDSGVDRSVRVWSRIGSASWTTSEGTVLVALAERLALLSLADESLSTLAETPGAAALYRFADRSLESMVDGVTLSNGLGWSPDGTRMYYVDSPTYRIDVFDYDVAAGTAANRRPFVELQRADGIPDGVAVDDEGGVWLALWGGSCVRRYSSAGGLEEVVDVPAAHVTACCFGGDDGRSLFITSAEPDGRLFVVENAGVSGRPSSRFQLDALRTAPSEADPRAIAREDAGVVRQRRQPPSREALRNRVVAQLERERLRVEVDADHVAVAHDRDRAAARRLGRDVAHHQTSHRSGEAAVRDERDGLAEPGADDGGGDAQHLRIPGPPAGPS